MAALVGVDSYLVDKPAPRPVRVDESALGVRDLLLRPACLDPRQVGGRPTDNTFATPAPVANLRHPDQARFGESFQLDGSASQAAAGHTIRSYSWTLKEVE
ncbi:MAG: hypothetical protein HC802_18565 [Caldilineaceae bacterium]|nr:hypothetical protein [Caldilineaceae bacterium]